MMQTLIALLPALVLLLAPFHGIAICSWYGGGFHGRLTASGRVYNQNALTAAHRTLPFGSVVLLRSAHGHQVTVIVTDRGPFVDGRDFDLSRAAFAHLADTSKGLLRVQWRLLHTGDWSYHADN